LPELEADDIASRPSGCTENPDASAAAAKRQRIHLRPRDRAHEEHTSGQSPMKRANRDSQLLIERRELKPTVEADRNQQR